MTIARKATRSGKYMARAAAVLSIAALALTGCSSGTAPAEPGGAGEGSVEEQGPIAMTVSRGQVNIENVLLAEQEGFFTDAGLDVTMVVGQGAQAQNSAAISGEFQVGLTDSTSVVRAVAEGMPIVVVAGTKFADTEYDGEISDGLLVPPGSPVESWADLGGMKIGIPDLGGLPHLSSLAALEANGVDPSTVQFVNLPLPALPEAAAKGDVDAIFVFSAFYLGAQDNGFTPIGTGVREYLPNVPQSLWIASRDYAEKNPEAIKRFREALQTGSEFGNENPDAVRAIYHEYSELPAPFIDNKMVLEPLSIDIPLDGWETLLNQIKGLGEIPDDLSVQDIVWEGAL